ncbi:3-deoxy-D-manno-octulosonic acid kinase [Vibrio sp. SCSIO 43135]|uniref:3-deoxy-D-manno-octulosonic acid kinase n=1 Tax=Vibrio sp. SCSIO 43135 TaxID=2819096 RepID=UPI002075400F|nr:3-deoxy-D-manno-octulosonic acid kinase [Vibrio sp. SCSIO 43135]USD41272.1 3-deoxy-D-manno-octulosonic acid kinase [Vibrio sp. SCSIO 43135]
MLTKTQSSNTTYWYNPALLIEEVESAFSVDFWKRREAVIGSAQGRGTTWFIRGGLIPIALRHYYRGGLLGRIFTDKYLFWGLANSRPYKELKTLEILSKAGVNVPRPIAAKITVATFTYRADILVELIKDAKDLVSVLKSESLSPEILYRIGQEIRKMHDTQVNHRDLNIHNILIDKNKKVWLIDFDKCGQQRGNKWKKGNLSRLLRSFKKEQTLGNINALHYDFNVIMQGYND